MRIWANVSIEDLPPHRGYFDPAESWNGALMPYFTRGEGMRMDEWVRAIGDERLLYDESRDEFYTYLEGDGVTEEFPGVDVDGMHLYPIGRGGWLWSVSDMQDDETVAVLRELGLVRG